MCLLQYIYNLFMNISRPSPPPLLVPRDIFLERRSYINILYVQDSRLNRSSCEVCLQVLLDLSAVLSHVSSCKSTKLDGSSVAYNLKARSAIEGLRF